MDSYFLLTKCGFDRMERPRLIIVSWMLVGLGLFAYKEFGLLMAVAPFGFAAYLRKDHDVRLKNALFNNKHWKYFAIIYYLVLLGYSLVNNRVLYEIDSTLLSAGIMLFPVLIGMLVYDLRIIFLTQKSKRS